MPDMLRKAGVKRAGKGIEFNFAISTLAIERNAL
jgi:hypothetical protein